jgi:hypothetical protein
MDQRRWAAGDTAGAAGEREDGSEDEGGACEDEGSFDEKEPDLDHLCNWQDDGDKTRLRLLKTRCGAASIGIINIDGPVDGWVI